MSIQCFGYVFSFIIEYKRVLPIYFFIQKFYNKIMKFFSSLEVNDMLHSFVSFMRQEQAIYMDIGLMRYVVALFIFFPNSFSLLIEGIWSLTFCTCCLWHFVRVVLSFCWRCSVILTEATFDDFVGERQRIFIQT